MRDARISGTIPHLFLNCDTTRWIWNFFPKGFQVKLVDEMDIGLWLSRRNTGRMSKTGALIWKDLKHTRIFEGKKRLRDKMCMDIMHLLWSWNRFDPIVRGSRFENIVFSWDATVRSHV